MSNLHLFDLPTGACSDGTGATRSNQRTGAVAEFLLISELLARGHRVAVPVVDDDGIDLIVNYRTLVQVKAASKARRQRDGLTHFYTFSPGRRSGGFAAHVDVVALHAFDTDTWWFVPADVVAGRRGVSFTASGGSHLDEWRDYWAIFDDAM